MIKFITLRVLRWRLKNTLPKINSKYYKKIFTLSYKLFYFIKPSQVWIIILALLNKSDLKKLLSIPSLFLLFSNLFSESESLKTNLNSNTLYAELVENKFTDHENKWENFFWILIVMAIIHRVINKIFKILWVPFKLALFFYVLKYFGYDFSNLFNILNTLSLGIIEWFLTKWTDFLNLFIKK